MQSTMSSSGNHPRRSARLAERPSSSSNPPRRSARIAKPLASSQPFRLLDLPNELVLEIADKLPYTCVNALLRTSRDFAQLLAPTLWRHAYTAQLPRIGSVLCWAIRFHRHALAHRLLVGDRRRQLVRRSGPRERVSVGEPWLHPSVLMLAVRHMRDNNTDDLELLRAMIAAGAPVDSSAILEVLFRHLPSPFITGTVLSLPYARTVLGSLLETLDPILPVNGRCLDSVINFYMSWNWMNNLDAGLAAMLEEARSRI